MTLTSVDLKLNHISGFRIIIKRCHSPETNQWTISSSWNLNECFFVNKKVTVFWECLSLSVAYCICRCAVKIVNSWSWTSLLTLVWLSDSGVSGQSNEGHQHLSSRGLCLFQTLLSPPPGRPVFCLHPTPHLSTHCIHYWPSWIAYCFKFTINTFYWILSLNFILFFATDSGSVHDNLGACLGSEPGTSGTQSKNRTTFTQNHMSTCWCC